MEVGCQNKMIDIICDESAKNTKMSFGWWQNAIYENATVTETHTSHYFEKKMKQILSCERL